MSLTLLYPVRLPPFYFTSVSDRWFGEGRVGLLELLKRPRPEPEAAVVAVHADATTAEAQAVRAVTVPWVST